MGTDPQKVQDLLHQLLPVHFQFHLVSFLGLVVVVDFVGALRSVIGFWVGRVGRARRVGLFIFKKQMPSGFTHERCLGYIMRNSMSKASSGYFAFSKALPGFASVSI